ncbi:hypothetical protein Bca52824_058806 [Brassica carinata]|uniref:Retrotransposon gag domain-containing protein n=1 Tax=Brassica carinata TaxID=52824 RepID=A0A8X7QUA0_BRACI|nr:hypothetical protein Bca52824_058806 [Brassica carinata]
MVETRTGSDREKAMTSEAVKSVDLQQIQDDIAQSKLNHEKLAHNDRTTTKKLDSLQTKVDSIEAKLNHITDVLSRFETSAPFIQRQGKEVASTSAPPVDQVSIPISEPERSPTQLGYRRIHGTLANRDKMLRKIEMHVFSGALPFDWISRVERFFRFGNYNEEEKLQLVSLSLEGPVLQWFNGEILSEPFLSWEQFTDRMLDRFSGPIDNDPATRLFRLQQEGEIEEYVDETSNLLLSLRRNLSMKWFVCTDSLRALFQTGITSS